MRIPFFQVDAFVYGSYSGNPAAVCMLQVWPDDVVMQHIAEENNLSETAFLVKESHTHYQLRWFTPRVEVNLCGHATLAAALVLYECYGIETSTLTFATRSGVLTVTRSNDRYSMNFPTSQAVEKKPPPGLLSAMRLHKSEISGVFCAEDIVIVVPDENTLDRLDPDFSLLANIKTRGVVVTAAAKETDFRSRWFGPAVGVNEDPITGSAHTFLAPLWAARLGKNVLTASQGGHRKGVLTCILSTPGRIDIQGRGRLVIKGEFILSQDGNRYDSGR
jgi:PhzF family phenazine biosynthesis protein